MKNSFDPQVLRFRGTTDKDAVSYHVGETMTFIFSFEYKGDPEDLPDLFVRWSRTGDDGQPAFGMERIGLNTPVTVTTSIDRPGTVRMLAHLTCADGKMLSRTLPDGTDYPHKFEGGAIADFDQIRPVSTMPDDFDEFWKKQRAILDAVPVKAEMKRLSDDRMPEKFRGTHAVYAVSVTCAGPRPVTGFLFMRTDAAPKSMAARCVFHGYGLEDYSDARFDEAQFALSDSAVTFNVNAHGYELEREKDYYTDTNKKLEGYGLDLEENKNPETSYFRNMAFRVIRAFDFIKTHSLWNGKDLYAQGGSQGGLQTVWAGSLVPELTECHPNITWCSDLAGRLAGRLAGWLPAYCRGLDYYDTVFHSMRIPDSCWLCVDRFGLGDDCCPPSGTAAHFNAAHCRKKAYWYQNSQHCGVPPEDEREIFVREFPAGHTITGTAARFTPQPRPPVSFVPAHFDHAKWRLFRDDGTEVAGFTFCGKQTDFRHGRAADGGDLPVEYGLRLTGELVAERDGFALIGAGFDWWWNVSVGGVPVFGRIRTFGCNDFETFEKTDWIFRTPVKKGVNSVEIEIIAGNRSVGNIDVLSDSFAGKEISLQTAENYERMQSGYDVPESTVDFQRDGLVFRFRSAQPFPAGIEFRETGSDEWLSVWDTAFAREHEITMPDDAAGKECEIRICQNAYLCGWTVRSSEPETIRF